MLYLCCSDERNILINLDGYLKQVELYIDSRLLILIESFWLIVLSRRLTAQSLVTR